MVKHFITALLVVILLAPQTGLEAKSRHHGVKERDHHAEDRDDKANKRHRYSRYKKYIKKYRHSHATKTEMELLKQAISDINTKMDALEPQGQFPAELAAKLETLQSVIDVNSDAIGANSSDISLAMSDIVNILMEIEKIGDNAAEIDRLNTAVTDLSTRLGALELIVDNHETRIAALEDPPFVGVNFSGVFTQGEAPGPLTKAAWGIFIDSIDSAAGEFKSIEIINDLGGRAFCSDSVLSTKIASLLENFKPNDPTVSESCDGRSWNIGHYGDGVALSAGGSINVNDCGNNATVRPLINHENWGGIDTTCGALGQNLEVILTR